MVHLPCVALLVAGAVSAQAEPLRISCPPRTPDHALRSAPRFESWEVHVEPDGPHSGLALYDGDPDHGGQRLVPDAESGPKEHRIRHFRLDKLARPPVLWLQCEYLIGTLAMQRAIPGHYRHCTTRFEQSPQDPMQGATLTCE